MTTFASMSRQSRDNHSPNRSRPRSLFGQLNMHASNLDASSLQDPERARQKAQGSALTKSMSSSASASLTHSIAFAKKLSLRQATTTITRHGSALPNSYRLQYPAPSGIHGSPGAPSGSTHSPIPPNNSLHSLRTPTTGASASVIFPTNDSVDGRSDDLAFSGVDQSFTSSAATDSPSQSDSSFKKKSSLKLRVSVTLSGLFSPKPKKIATGGFLDGLDGVHCERDLELRSRKGRFLSGFSSKGRKDASDAEKAPQDQEERYSYISRSPSPPSPEIRPPSGLGKINPNADMNLDNGFRGRNMAYRLAGSHSNMDLRANGSTSRSGHTSSPSPMPSRVRPLTSPDGSNTRRRTRQTPTPTSSNFASVSPSPLLRRSTSSSSLNIFYTGPATKASHPSSTLPSISSPIPPETLIYTIAPSQPTFPPSPALTPPTSKLLTASASSRSIFTPQVLVILFPYLGNSTMSTLACVSRAFCRNTRPVLYADISFENLRPNLRKCCLLSLASNPEIAKFTKSFSWNALIPLDQHNADVGEADAKNLEGDIDVDSGDDNEGNLLSRAISNMTSLQILTLSLSKSGDVLSHVRSQLVSLSCTGLAACSLFLSTWLPTQPSLKELALPDVFLFPSATALLPRLEAFTGTSSLARFLVPGRPVHTVEMQISQTLWDGLRPGELMRDIGRSAESLRVLRIRVTGKVDLRTLGKVLNAASIQLGNSVEVLGVVGWEGESKDLYSQITPALSHFNSLQTLELFSEVENSDDPAPIATDETQSPMSIFSNLSLISNALTPSYESPATSEHSGSRSCSLELDAANDSEESKRAILNGRSLRVDPYRLAHALADAEAELFSPAREEVRRKLEASEREQREKQKALEATLLNQWRQRCPTLRKVHWASGDRWSKGSM